MSVRPFSPSESFAFPAPPPRESQLVSPMIPLTPSPMIPIPPITETPPVAMENPFADAFAAAPAPSSPPFAAVETIFRAFSQTLQDELSVQSGDQVKVLAVYDDGWAMVERIDVSGKGKGMEGAKVVGLIPIDCMRRADESVTSFLAAKRVSSVDVDATGYTAMAV
ncbi:hypothetical protein C8F01DRAFT_976022 [Mycena amicta]|nr:hypothetical protein C8F01DRAFT_976022 [Mycena amicta]